MVKFAVIGALASLLLVALPARADWRARIHGAEPALPSAFTLTVHPRPHARSLEMLGSTPILPSRFTPKDPGAPPAPMPIAGAIAPRPPDALSLETAPEPFVPSPQVWSLPLVDRRLSQGDRTADLAGDLQDAVMRIEPMYDPTRLDGPDGEMPMVVSAGTAAMDSVFADHWRLASPDANVNAKVKAIAMAWQRPIPLSCDAFLKNRPHVAGDAALSALSDEDCRVLLRYERLGYSAAPPLPIVAAPVSVPVFAAPLPGARMSSEAFWAARKARIDAIRAHLHEKWRSAQDRVSEAVGLRQ